MRNLKKLASIVLAAVMTLALAVPAFASGFDPNQPGITIENAQKDVTYNVYEIFKMTGSNGSYSYEATEAWIDFFTSGAGASYVTSFADANETTNKSFPVNIGTGSYYFNLIGTGEDANIVAFAKAAQAYAMTLDAPTAAQTATADGALSFQLELGYYLVNPYGLSQQSSESAGSLCNLTIAEPNQTIKVKAEKPAINKTAEDGASAVVKGVGDIVNFTITGKVPDTSDYTTYQYIVADKMSSGLTFNADSLKVVLVAADGTETDITASCSPAGVADKDFSLSIPVQNHQDCIGDTIKITYTATVNPNAVEKVEPETNEATLTYSNDPSNGGTGETATTTEVVVKVYDVQINVDKYALNAEDDTDHSHKLAGAKFALYKMVEVDGTPTKQYYQYIAAAGGNPAELNWVDDVEDATIATTVVTEVDGKQTCSLDFVFRGLAPNTSYYLEETEAPEGYNKMAADRLVVFDIQYANNNTGEGSWEKVSETTVGETTTITYLNTVSLNHVEEVMNSTGAELPETGGMGTTLFYALGGLLVVGAGILLITKKRMGAE